MKGADRSPGNLRFNSSSKVLRPLFAMSTQSCVRRLQVAKLEVLGMHCSACSSAVESALGAIQGVQHCAVSLTMQQAEVEYDPVTTSEVCCSI